MKRIVLTLLACLTIFFANSQPLKSAKDIKRVGWIDCGMMIVDLGSGSVNGMNPVASPEQIKDKFPCFTGVSEEDSPENCNGGIFYKTRDVYFYTKLDCINIRSKFTGSFIINRENFNVFGMTLGQLTSLLGKTSDFYKPATATAHTFPVFPTSYGLLVFEMVDNHVVEVNICNQQRSELKLCN